MSDDKPGNIRIRWSLIWAGACLGSLVIAAGWTLGHVYRWGPTVEAIGINVGTAIGLAGLLAAYQGKLEERIDEISAQMHPVPADGIGLRSRSEVIAEYVERVQAVIAGGIENAFSGVPAEAGITDLLRVVHRHRAEVCDPVEPFSDWYLGTYQRFRDDRLNVVIKRFKHV